MLCTRMQAAEIVVATPSSTCHISLTHQAPLEAGAPPKDVWGAEYPYQSVNTAQSGNDAGENFRVLPMLHPVLMLAYTSPSSLLLVSALSTLQMLLLSQFKSFFYVAEAFFGFMLGTGQFEVVMVKVANLFTFL